MDAIIYSRCVFLSVYICHAKELCESIWHVDASFFRQQDVLVLKVSRRILSGALTVNLKG